MELRLIFLTVLTVIEGLFGIGYAEWVIRRDCFFSDDKRELRWIQLVFFIGTVMCGVAWVLRLL